MVLSPFLYEEPSDFEISVLNGEALQFKASNEYYLGPKSYNRSGSRFDQKINAINEELGVKYGGHVVAIDNILAVNLRKVSNRPRKAVWTYQL